MAKSVIDTHNGDTEYVYSTHISEGRPFVPVPGETVVQKSPQGLRGVGAELLHRRPQEATADHEQDLKCIAGL